MVAKHKLKKNKSLCLVVLLLALVSMGQNDPEFNGNPHEIKAQFDSDILAFPDFSEDYKNKILRFSGDYEILTQNQLLAWASSQGIAITEDHPFGNIQYKRAIYFNPPGLRFHLEAKKDELGNFNAFGQSLILDLALFRPHESHHDLTSHYKNFNNLQEIDVYVDGIFYKNIVQGFGKITPGPVVIQLPFIRDKRGQILVELKMKNHPTNFGILYDASLSQNNRP